LTVTVASALEPLQVAVRVTFVDRSACAIDGLRVWKVNESWPVVSVAVAGTLIRAEFDELKLTVVFEVAVWSKVMVTSMVSLWLIVELDGVMITGWMLPSGCAIDETRTERAEMRVRICFTKKL
jgi:hypothetical protein